MSERVSMKKTKQSETNNGKGVSETGKEPSSITNSEMLRMSGAGAPLPMSTGLREKFEQGFFSDFSNIRISHGHIPEEFGLKGVARGNNILLDSSASEKDLGHELAHVVQQASGRIPHGGYPVVEDLSLEHEADLEGARIASRGMSETGSALSIGPMSTAEAEAMPAQCKKDKKPKVAAPEPIPPAAKPKTDITGDPGEMSFAAGSSKGVKDSTPGANSVFRMGTTPGASVYMKAGAKPVEESALAEYFNTGGAAFDRRGGSSWSFDAPAARGLTAAERPHAEAMLRSGTLAGQTKGDPGSIENQLAATTVFSAATGRSRQDPQTTKGRDWGTGGAITANPTNPQEVHDYRRMMGYTSAMDLAVGNGDRTYSSPNVQNWMEDRDSRQVHLIDNAFDHATSVTQGRAGRSDWLSDVLTRTEDLDAHNARTGTHSMGGFGQHMKAQIPAAQELLQGAGIAGRTSIEEDIFGEETAVGSQQALEDMPRMREDLERKFRAQGHGGDLPEIQQELLERMRIMPEVMDPSMQPLYKQLAAIGMDATPEEAPDVAERRAGLYQQLEEKRQEKENAKFGGQTRGPIDRSTISGHGSAADWLAPYGGQTHGPIDRSTIPGHQSASDWYGPSTAPTAPKKKRGLFGRGK